MVSFAPAPVHCPYSGTWSLRKPRPPLHKPSDGVTPNSSPFAHSPLQSPPQVRSPKSKLLRPAPIHTGDHVSQTGEYRVMVLTICTGFFPF